MNNSIAGINPILFCAKNKNNNIIGESLNSKKFLYSTFTSKTTEKDEFFETSGNCVRISIYPQPTTTDNNTNNNNNNNNHNDWSEIPHFYLLLNFNFKYLMDLFKDVFESIKREMKNLQASQSYNNNNFNELFFAKTYDLFEKPPQNLCNSSLAFDNSYVQITFYCEFLSEPIDSLLNLSSSKYVIDLCQSIKDLKGKLDQITNVTENPYDDIMKRITNIDKQIDVILKSPFYCLYNHKTLVPDLAYISPLNGDE